MAGKAQEAGYAVGEFLKVLRALKLTTKKESLVTGAKFWLKYVMGATPLGRTERKPRTTSTDMYGSSIFNDNASF